uniref:IncFIIk replication protein RepA4 n=1 Tax=Serratia marcescens TaxID=615 RepID=A0A6H0ABN1_SERMA|nr:IncFIIk replication protein RepA4 [Serratia marcescens]
MPCGQAAENARPCSDLTVAPVRQHQRELPSLRDGPRPENQISYSIHKDIHHKTSTGLPVRCPSPPLKSAAQPRPTAGEQHRF